tara:strand:+ start:206 stop:1207 length:1002 start_codon:yes stop_codon:yes gene_type:complete
MGKGEGHADETTAPPTPEDTSEIIVDDPDMEDDEDEDDINDVPEAPGAHVVTLHECAATPGSAQRCHELLENGADPLKQDAEGRSALHVAAIHGNVEILEQLREHVISVDPFDIHRLSPLISAIRAEQDGAVQLLIKQGAKLTLNVAFALGDLHLINRIFSEDKEAFKHCKAPDELMTDLTTAIRRECDKKITENGAANEAAKITIEETVIERYVPTIERVVDMGCHPDTFESAPYPALFQAVQFRSPRLAATLLRHDANPDFEADDGKTPLGVATAKRPAMQALLKEHGAEEYGGQPHESTRPKKEDDGPGVSVPTIKTNHPSPSELKSRRK